MNIENYLNEKCFKYFYFDCSLDEHGYKKVNNMPLGFEKFEQTNIINHNNIHKNCNSLIHDTKKYQIIDVDDLEQFNIYFGHLNLLNSPHYLSFSKKLPHIFVSIIGKPYKKFESIKVGNINICDLMLSKGTFCNRKEQVINHDKEILTLDYSEIVKIKEHIKSIEKQKIIKDKEDKKNKKKEEKEQNKKKIPKVIKYDANLLNKILLEILPVRIVDNYEYWIKIAYAIYNTYGDDGLIMFNNVSSKSPTKYDPNKCNEVYKPSNNTNNKISFASIVEILKNEDNELYMHYQNLKDSLFIENDDKTIAEYIKKQNDKKYFITGAKGEYSCYKYEDGTYKSLDSYNQCISSLLINYGYRLNTINKSIIKIKSLINNAEIIEDVDDILIKIQECIKKSKTARFLRDVKEFLETLFYVEKFDDKLNVNPNLLGIGKYVYDFNKCDYRLATPEDYISLAINPTKEEIEGAGDTEIKEYLRSLFPTDEQYNFILDMLSLTLAGHPKDYFNIWSNSGGNGKSKFASVIKLALGEYAGSLNSSYITTGNDKPITNNVSSELARNRYVRFLLINEPDENCIINNSRLKSLSGGGDGVDARLLRKNAISYKPQFTPYILCNDRFKLQNPKEDNIDRRLKFHPFTQTFDDSKVGQKNIQPRNPKLMDDDFLKLLATQLIKLLLDNYKNAKRLLGKNITEPAISRKYKEKFIKLNDPVSDFYCIKINKVMEDKKNNVGMKYVLFSDVMEHYKMYCSANNYKPQTKKELLENLKTIHGKENYKSDMYVGNGNAKRHLSSVFLRMEIIDEDNEDQIKEGTKIYEVDNNDNIINITRHTKE